MDQERATSAKCLSCYSLTHSRNQLTSWIYIISSRAISSSNYQTTDVCLEPSYMYQLQDIVQQLYAFVFGESAAEDTIIEDTGDKFVVPAGALQDCDAQQFMKLKFARSETKSKHYKDYYEEGVILDQILGEISLTLDSFKTETKRESTQILDYLGDIGGFEAAIQMFFVIVGEYFSARYFMSSIAKTLFIRKKNKKEVDTSTD